MRVDRIKYPMGAVTAEGALIYDENVSGKRPAVLLAPNWMGMTDNAIQRGELVAAKRYVVFVADMYGAGTRPADFGEAAALANPPTYPLLGPPSNPPVAEPAAYKPGIGFMSLSITWPVSGSMRTPPNVKLTPQPTWMTRRGLHVAMKPKRTSASISP